MMRDNPHHRELVVDEHIRLITPSLDHAAASLSWQSADVVGYMGGDNARPSLEKEQKRIRDILASADEYSWMIERDGVIIGNVSLNDIKETSEKFGVRACNLVILVGDRNFWGQGIGSTVCRAVIDWAFKDAGFEAIGARAVQENIGSIKTLQKVGFEEIGTEPFDGLIDGKESVWMRFRLDAGILKIAVSP